MSQVMKYKIRFLFYGQEMFCTSIYWYQEMKQMNHKHGGVPLKDDDINLLILYIINLTYVKPVAIYYLFDFYSCNLDVRTNIDTTLLSTIYIRKFFSVLCCVILKCDLHEWFYCLWGSCLYMSVCSFNTFSILICLVVVNIG